MKALISFIILIQFVIIGQLNANVGGATLKPGLFGKPFTWELTNIEIEKEVLNLRFQNYGGKRICFFTAVYYLKSDTIHEFSVSSIFYGLKAKNIEVKYNSEKLLTKIDSGSFEKIDSLIFASTRKTIPKAVWFDWKNLSKTGFTFKFKPNSINTLQVSGIIELKPTKIWYGMTTPAIYAKHPFLNQDLSEGNEYLHYLITPIETWKSVGEIEIIIDNPDNLDIIYFKGNKNVESKKKNSLNQEQFIFKDSIPSHFSVQIMKETKMFYIGGGIIGFAKNEDNQIVNRFGWEIGLNQGIINTLIALDYETDYLKFHQISLTVIPSTPWLSIIVPNIGLGLGIPFRFENNTVHSGIRLRADFSWSLFNISLNADYIPNLNERGIRTNFYGVTF